MNNPKQTVWRSFSKRRNDDDQNTKLVTFRVPNSIVSDFDELVKFKRGSRTSYLVGFMDQFVRSEFKRLEESNRVNEFIHNVRNRNLRPSKLTKTSDDVWRNHKDDYEPPNIPTFYDDDNWEVTRRWNE